MIDHRKRRPLRAAAVLAIGLAAVALPGAARAQFFGGWGGWDDGGGRDELAPQQVRRAIAGRGFRVLAPLRRNGNVYVADVMDPRGRHERLIVAAADAQILQRFIVDDGQGVPGVFPRGAEDGRGVVARGSDDDRGPVPPGDIPNFPRRSAPPLDRDAAPRRFGDPGADDPDAVPSFPAAQPPRDQPAIRTVKPRSRVVERTPEAPSQGREPGVVEATPLTPVAPRPAAAPVVKAPTPAPAPAVAALRPAPAAVAPVPPPVAPSPAASTTATRRMTDPLAIPANGDPKPVRNVATGVTGAPPPVPSAGKPGDVPVAPLD